MNNDPSPTPPVTRKWWWLLIAVTALCPFMPFSFSAGMMRHGVDYAGLMIGMTLWLLCLVVVSAILGWHLGAGRRTVPRVGLTLLFTMAACAIGLGLGFAECATVKAIWPKFPL